MKNIKIRLKKLMWSAALLLLLAPGCVDLEEKPLDFPGPDNFYATEDQIISALTGAMASFGIERKNNGNGNKKPTIVDNKDTKAGIK